MNRFILSMVMLVASLHGFAQHEVGSLKFMPKLGVNLATIAGDDTYYHWEKDGSDVQLLKSKYRIGVVAGIEGEYQMSQPLSLSVGILYSLQGNKYDDIDYQRNYSSTFHAVNVPVLLNFYVVKGLALKAGLQAGYVFYKKTSYDSLIDGSWVNSSTSASIYNPFDISVPVGISYDFDRWRVDLRYNYGLTSISKLEGLPTVHNRVIQLSLGYCL
jgi:hypothetical protein